MLLGREGVRFYIGPWQTDSSGGFVPPASHAGSALDLRGQAGGVGLFHCSTHPGSDYTDLGDTLDGNLTAGQRNVWRDRVGMTRAPASFRLLDILWETLTAAADSDGEKHARPIMPTHKGISELYVGTLGLVQSKPFTGQSDPAWPVIQRQVRASYKAIKQRDTALAAKYGECVRRKLRVPFEEIAEKGDKPIRPATTLSEDFNQANSTTLGPQLSWVELSGDAETRSNRCAVVGDFGKTECHATTGLSVDDLAAQVRVYGITTNAREAGALVRVPGTGTRTYYAASLTGGGDGRGLARVVNGAFTSLSQVGASDPADGTFVRCRALGSTISIWVDGVQHESVTDTNISGFVYGGLVLRNAAQLDDWSMSDLVAPSSANTPIQHLVGACM